jgi:hypothetical protein
MEKTMFVELSVILLSVVGQGEAAAVPVPVRVPVSTLVPDPTWGAKPGDRVHAYSSKNTSVFAAVDVYTYRDMTKALRAGDYIGVKLLMDRGKVICLSNRTPILVIESTRNTVLFGNYPVLEVRIESGVHRDTLAWIMFRDAARLVPQAQIDAANCEKQAREELARRQEMARVDAILWKEKERLAEAKRAQELVDRAHRKDQESKQRIKDEAKARAKPKTFKSGTPALNASNTYRTARQLETSGKVAEAIVAYKELSGTVFPEARLAAQRLKVLTGK